MRLHAVVITALAFSSGPVVAQSAPLEPVVAASSRAAHSVDTTRGEGGDVVGRISRHMALHERHTGFSGMVLVARHGRPLVARAYGLADREWEAPVTARTRFRIGSITKPFTSAAILMLAERGKLALDDPVCRYVSPCPAAWGPATIRHLLSHTSGIPDFTRLEALRGGELREQTPAELASAVAGHPLAFAPGTGWDYSNSGYLLLGMVIEKVSGRAYEDFLRDEIFVPAGMTATARDRPGSPFALRRARRAPLRAITATPHPD